MLVLAGWYVVLVLAHYFNQCPLWTDELRVLDSIVRLSPQQLFARPLLSDQAFPRLYLWVIQQFSNCFHQHLLSLRFFSLIFMLAAFFVWLKIAQKILGQGWKLIFFVGGWCASMPLVYHAAELKPYSMDVLACGLIVEYLLEGRKSSDRHDFFYKSRACHYFLSDLPEGGWFFLPFLGLWSYPAVFLLLLPLFNLRGRKLYCYLGGYILVLGLLYFFDYRVSAHELMQIFWHDYFISLDSLRHFLDSFGKGLNNLVGRRLAENPHWVKGPSRVLFGMGLIYMLMVFWNDFKKDKMTLRSIVPIAFAMFFLQLLLAILRVYPFAVPRMSLFFTPLMLMMTILAIEELCRRIKPIGILLRIAFAGYLVFISAGITWDVFINKDLGAEAPIFSHSTKIVI